MRSIKPQFIARTLDVWQPRTPKVLTVEDARQIAHNVTGFFQVLLEWETAETRPVRPITKTDDEPDCHSPEGRPT
jgi:hypothetical protein